MRRGMTSSEASRPTSPSEDTVVAAHLAAIAEMHAAALAHIAALAEPWLQSAEGAGRAAPATNRMAAVTARPSIEKGWKAAA